MSGLAARIRLASSEAHQAAERAPFVQDLLAGRLPLHEYARMARQHHAVYAALEAAVAANRDPVVARFLDPRFTRLPALVEDLEHLVGLRWREELEVLASTEAYVAHLRRAVAAWPGALLAHHYVRYLGDLSGGQVIGRVLQRVYRLPGTTGTEFYRFADIPSAKAVKVAYRQGLDELPWAEPERRRLIDEVGVAFECNAAVLLELAPLPMWLS